MLILNYYKMKNLMVRKFAIILAAVLGIQMAAAAQGLTVSGSVTDETGYPLEGATVMIRGTTNGTITDADGLYRIDVEPDEEIIVSYLGYLSQTRKVNGQPKLNSHLLSVRFLLSLGRRCQMISGLLQSFRSFLCLPTPLRLVRSFLPLSVMQSL